MSSAPTATRFFDPQVNGYAGVDFNADDLNVEALAKACQGMRTDGVERFLPTLITDSMESLVRRIRQLVAIADEDSLCREMVAGLHIEGPFMQPEQGYIGAHPVEHAIPPSLDAAKRLIEAGQGRIRIVTLAPERDADCIVTRFLSDQGIVVSAGHTNASRDQLQRSIDAGLKMVTHLGNGCPVNLPRHDNIVQRVLSLADSLFISFIADSHHIPLFALKNYLRLVPKQQVVLTTDAIAAAGLGPGTFPLAGRYVRVAEGDAPRFDDSGNLAGSAATMPQMVTHLQSMGISRSDQAAYCHDNIVRLLGL
ncbi:MAG: N-acetylglucosamine-6-phosphate deacetylase, partial [Pirellulaceae bacterium]